jgi:hypothetical protein
VHEEKGRPSVASVWLNLMQGGRRNRRYRGLGRHGTGGTSRWRGHAAHVVEHVKCSGVSPRRRISSGKATEHVLIGVCQMSVPARWGSHPPVGDLLANWH